jgi:hypothetical protein
MMKVFVRFHESVSDPDAEAALHACGASLETAYRSKQRFGRGPLFILDVTPDIRARIEKLPDAELFDDFQVSPATA